MRKSTFTTAAAAAFAALSIGLAAPSSAAPSGPDTPPRPPTQPSGADAHSWFGKPGQNAYGWYQNDNPRQSASRR